MLQRALELVERPAELLENALARVFDLMVAGGRISWRSAPPMTMIPAAKRGSLANATLATSAPMLKPIKAMRSGSTSGWVCAQSTTRRMSITVLTNR
jgi:hypothetical protein